jgi:chitinase
MLNYPYTNIDWSALTHLVVALAYMGNGATLHYQGGNLNSTLARQVTAAAHAHGKKVILMVGGAGSAADFAAAVNYGANAPQTFVNNILAMAQGDGFDGVDIDWEGLYSPDYAGFKKLATALRAAWPGMILTCPLGWDQTGNAFFGTLEDASGQFLFDQFNVMNYDAANSWPGWISWYFNALAGEGPDHPSSVTASLRALNVTGGVPKSRIGMGIPFYGSGWSGGNPPVTGPRQRISAGAAGSQGSDVWSYKYIMDNYYQPYDPATGIGYVFDSVAGVPYISGGPNGYSRNGAPKITWLSFEDETSIAGKGAWLKANGYGGTIVWLINQGAIDAAGTNPLLTAVKKAFLE